MSKPQYVCRNGKQSIKQARNLIASVSPTQDMLDRTIEYRSSEDVVCKCEKLYFVRSSFSPIRYYPVAWNDERACWECTCHQQGRPHKHIRKINEYIQAQKEVVA